MAFCLQHEQTHDHPSAGAPSQPDMPPSLPAPLLPHGMPVHVAEALSVPLHILLTVPWLPTTEIAHPWVRAWDANIADSVVAAAVWVLRPLVAAVRLFSPRRAGALRDAVARQGRCQLDDDAAAGRRGMVSLVRLVQGVDLRGRGAVAGPVGVWMMLRSEAAAAPSDLNCGWPPRAASPWSGGASQTCMPACGTSWACHCCHATTPVLRCTGEWRLCASGLVLAHAPLQAWCLLTHRVTSCAVLLAVLVLAAVTQRPACPAPCWCPNHKTGDTSRWPASSACHAHWTGGLPATATAAAAAAVTVMWRSWTAPAAPAAAISRLRRCRPS